VTGGDPGRVRLAARNNAEWCDLVCRTHGVDTEFDRDVWVARHRSPPLYPDAVTLRDGVPAGAVLARVDASPGCSVKDSFASLDLSAEGFRPLFEAQWVWRPAGGARPEPGLAWTVARTAEHLRAWAAAHGGGDTFRPELLDDPAVTIVMGHDGPDLVAGAVGNHGGAVVGLSNVFVGVGAGVDDPGRAWAEASDAVAAAFPGLDLVGYEDGAALRTALDAGFVAVGPLRVWLKD
jgi:hypothetical protein